MPRRIFQLVRSFLSGILFLALVGILMGDAGRTPRASAQTAAGPTAQGPSLPQRFQPTERLGADIVVDFPVDI